MPFFQRYINQTLSKIRKSLLTLGLTLPAVTNFYDLSAFIHVHLRPIYGKDAMSGCTPIRNENDGSQVRRT